MTAFFSVIRDLYFVLLAVFVLEQFSGTDLLHDSTRKGVIFATVICVVVKVLQPLVDPSPGGAGGNRAPRRQKKTESGKTDLLDWVSSEMQGWRPAMEDATCIMGSLPAPLESQAFFAVFDGHGGAQVSQIASKEFTQVLIDCVKDLQKEEAAVAGEAAMSARDDVGERDGAAAAKKAKNSDPEEFSEACSNSTDDAISDDGGPAVDPLRNEPPKQKAASKAEIPNNSSQSLTGKSLHLAMLRMDSSLRKRGNGIASRAPLSLAAKQQEAANPDKKNLFNLMGSTAIIAVLDCGNDPATASRQRGQRRPTRVVVANCGDSRAVLCRKGVAVELSKDHKPESPSEEERIRNAGGHVAQIGPCHRVDGWGLNLSRALGDFHYKGRSDLPPDKQKVIAVPEIQTLDLTDDDEFLLLGCDGIFEMNTCQSAIDIVRGVLRSGSTLEQAVEVLLDKSCSPDLQKTRGKGSDNCSAIVVKLRANAAAM